MNVVTKCRDRYGRWNDGTIAYYGYPMGKPTMGLYTINAIMIIRRCDKMSRWQDKLTKKEKKHLSENGIRTKEGLLKNYLHQYVLKAQGHPTLRCWECIRITKKVYGVE